MSTRLIFEPVPETCELHNLKVYLSDDATWRAIRQAHAEATDYRCMVCGAQGRHLVELHEAWRFHDDRRLQEFTGFEVLCPACHEVKHFGLALAKGRGHIARKRLCEINRWTDALADAHIEVAFSKWADRSATYDWSFDLRVLYEVAAEIHWSPDVSFNDDLAAWSEIRANRDALDPRRRHVLLRLPPTTFMFAHQDH